MQKGCLSFRSTGVPSASTRRYVPYGSANSVFGRGGTANSLHVPPLSNGAQGPPADVASDRGDSPSLDPAVQMTGVLHECALRAHHMGLILDVTMFFFFFWFVFSSSFLASSPACGPEDVFLQTLIALSGRSFLMRRDMSCGGGGHLTCRKSLRYSSV